MQLQLQSWEDLLRNIETVSSCVVTNVGIADLYFVDSKVKLLKSSELNHHSFPAVTIQYCMFDIDYVY